MPFRHAGDQLLADRRHALARSLVAHRPAQLVGLAGRESRRGDRHLHALLLEERNAERALQDRLERRVRIGHLLLSCPAAQVGMHHLALDRAGPDERDLHDEIVEARGFRRGSVFICARLSTWKTPMVSAAQRSS